MLKGPIDVVPDEVQENEVIVALEQDGPILTVNVLVLERVIDG